MVWWYWLVIGLFLLISEIVTPGGFFLLFFGCAAIIVGLLTVLGLLGPVWVQVATFAVTAIILVVAFRNALVKRTQHATSTQAPVDSLVGETLILQANLAPGEVGKAELRGTSWSVENIGTQHLKKHDRCKVVAVQGLTLQVR